jgi:hypothetical protein
MVIWIDHHFSYITKLEKKPKKPLMLTLTLWKVWIDGKFLYIRWQDSLRVLGLLSFGLKEQTLHWCKILR